jgi:hypothetical protein
MYEDQTFLTKVYLRTPVFIASTYWDRYRQHPDSCLSIATKTGQYDAIRQFFLNWLEKYLSEQGAKDIEAWKLLQNILWPYRHQILHRIRGQISYLFFLASRKFRKSLA